jgi:hypothetical protein
LHAFSLTTPEASSSLWRPIFTVKRDHTYTRSVQTQQRYNILSLITYEKNTHHDSGKGRIFVTLWKTFSLNKNVTFSWTHSVINYRWSRQLLAISFLDYISVVSHSLF